MSSINPKVSLDQLVFKALYYRFKDFIIPVGTIAVCCLLFIFLIVPQIQSWFALRDAVSGDSAKLEILQQNLQTISKLDDTKLDNYLSIASSALPADKDFAGVLQAISAAASNAGTSLGDYNFQIGDLVNDSTTDKSTQLPLQLTINIRGDLSTGRRFIEELKKQLPISDINSITANANQTVSFSIIFYYAPLPRITFDDSIPLVTLSPKDEAILNALKPTVTNGVDVGQQVSSGSSDLTPQ